MSNKEILYGLIGYPVSHSLSPAMHNAAFKALGINASYKLFEIKPDDLEDFLLKPDTEVIDTKGNRVRAGDIVGFNITIPHKVRAKEILDKAYPSSAVFDEKDPGRAYAFLIGSINTVKREPSPPFYWNSDVSGFIRSLKEDLNFDITGNKETQALVIGCGGAGRAVISALSWEGGGIAKIYAYDINADSTRAIEEHFSKFPRIKDKLVFVSKEQIAVTLRRCKLLVNASSLGMKEGDASPIAKNILHKDLRVYDAVYNRDTQLLKDAQALNIPAQGGSGMLLYQGVIAFALLTGLTPPGDVMRNALNKELKKI
ncbi:MAG: shikimate dehydrogenase [Candidatus Omnitrophica bacterium]|nr:shikimate dehydrogenase [Candidatus Omnitrophota bacterium]